MGVRVIAISESLSLSVCLSACRSVCPFASHKRHVQTSQHVLYMLPVAVVRSSSDDNAIGYVLLVLSRLSIMEHIDIAYLRFSYLFARGRQPVYTFTVNNCSTVVGDEVCYPRLPCVCRPNIEQELIRRWDSERERLGLRSAPGSYRNSLK